MENAEHLETKMDAAEYFEIGMSTPIGNVGIHATLPRGAGKTGTSGALSQLVLELSVQYKAIDKIYASNIAEDSSLPSIKVSAREKKNRRYVGYLSDFLKDWNQKKSKFISLRKDFVWDKFKTTISQLLQLKPDNISYNLTDDCSIFFKSIVKENNIYLELFFDEDSEENVEAIVNVYNNGKVVIAYGGSIENTFEKIQELFVSKDKIIVSTGIYNAISSTYFATAEF